jgi:hypothetical protein
MVWLLFASMFEAQAGTVFVFDNPTTEILAVDTRAVSLSHVAYAGVSPLATGMAYDPLENDLWLYATETYLGARLQLRRIDVATGRSYYVGVSNILAAGLSFDPISRQLIAVDDWGASSLSMLDAHSTWLGTGVESDASDWFDDGGFIVAMESTTGDFWEIAPPSAPVRLWANPNPSVRQPAGLAYDKDTRTFWLAVNGGIDVLEPEGFNHVGVYYMNRRFDAGAGSIDDVPNQTPELMVSGLCPGTMFATVVDATPGGHVQFGSSTRRGATMIGGGACAGTRLDLRTPTPRFDLVANSYGIASTTFQATAPMCGQLMQAVDMDTCLPTSVRVVDVVYFP